MQQAIGVISDTHGLLRPQALAALAGCRAIIHAGDVGSPEVLAQLAALAPVHAVRGNVDRGGWSERLPLACDVDIDGVRIHVLHILAELGQHRGADAVIYGHSHQSKIDTRDGVLFFNPGSAGPRRFSLPITVGRLTRDRGKLRAEIIDIGGSA
jgi:putative phosphoesterase